MKRKMIFAVMCIVGVMMMAATCFAGEGHFQKIYEETLGMHDLAQDEAVSKDFTIKVCYGQTESASAVLAFTVDRKYDNTPIGKPLGNIRTYIFDENGKEAVEGELCLAGYFADGYFHLPELVYQKYLYHFHK